MSNDGTNHSRTIGSTRHGITVDATKAEDKRRQTVRQLSEMTRKIQRRNRTRR